MRINRVPIRNSRGAGATKLSVCPRCSGCITCRQLSFQEARQIYLSPLHVYCILAERWASEQNATYLTLSARLPWSSRQLACSRICTSNPSKLHLRTMKIGKRYSLGQSPKIAAYPVEWKRVLYRSLQIAMQEVRNEATLAHLHDVRCTTETYIIYINSLEWTTRLACSRSPIIIKKLDNKKKGRQDRDGIHEWNRL